MRIVVEVADSQAAEVLKQVNGLLNPQGLIAGLEPESPINAIEESHLKLVMERRKDPANSKVTPLAEIAAKYEARSRFPS